MSTSELNRQSERDFPGRDSSLTEAQLSLPRRKPRHLMLSLSYRIARAGRRLVGRKKLLQICLDGAWILRRHAYEISGEVFGEQFHNQSLGLSEEMLQQWLPADGSFLDIGCGSGRWCRVAAPHSRDVVGIDYDSKHIEVAKRITQQPNVKFILGDITKSFSEQVGSREFDLALLAHVLEHVDDVDTFLRSIHALARMLIVEVPDFSADSLNAVRHELKRPFFSDADHVREYTLPILRGQLERNGWSIREEERHGGTLVVLAERNVVPSALTTG